MKKIICFFFAVLFCSKAYGLKETLGGKIIQNIEVLSPYKFIGDGSRLTGLVGVFTGTATYSNDSNLLSGRLPSYFATALGLSQEITARQSGDIGIGISTASLKTDINTETTNRQASDAAIVLSTGVFVKGDWLGGNPNTSVTVTSVTATKALISTMTIPSSSIAGQKYMVIASTNGRIDEQRAIYFSGNSLNISPLDGNAAGPNINLRGSLSSPYYTGSPVNPYIKFTGGVGYTIGPGSHETLGFTTLNVFGSDVNSGLGYYYTTVPGYYADDSGACLFAPTETPLGVSFPAVVWTTGKTWLNGQVKINKYLNNNLWVGPYSNFESSVTVLSDGFSVGGTTFTVKNGQTLISSPTVRGDLVSDGEIKAVNANYDGGVRASSASFYVGMSPSYNYTQSQIATFTPRNIGWILVDDAGNLWEATGTVQGAWRRAANYTEVYDLELSSVAVFRDKFDKAGGTITGPVTSLSSGTFTTGIIPSQGYTQSQVAALTPGNVGLLVTDTTGNLWISSGIVTGAWKRSDDYTIGP